MACFARLSRNWVPCFQKASGWLCAVIRGQSVGVTADPSLRFDLPLRNSSASWLGFGVWMMRLERSWAGSCSPRLAAECTWSSLDCSMGSWRGRVSGFTSHGHHLDSSCLPSLSWSNGDAWPDARWSDSWSNGALLSHYLCFEHWYCFLGHYHYSFDWIRTLVSARLSLHFASWRVISVDTYVSSYLLMFLSALLSSYFSCQLAHHFLRKWLPGRIRTISKWHSWQVTSMDWKYWFYSVDSLWRGNY